MNAAQKKTVEYFERIAKENGSTLEIVDDEFGVAIYETRSVEWDNEQNAWDVRKDGTAHIR